VKAFAELINRLLALFERWRRSKLQQEAQDEADQLADRPADWYNDHFGGVRRDDASQTDEANTDRDRE